MSQSSGAYGEADATEQKNEQHNNQRNLGKHRRNFERACQIAEIQGAQQVDHRHHCSDRSGRHHCGRRRVPQQQRIQRYRGKWRLQHRDHWTETCPVSLDIRHQSGSAIEQVLIGNVYEGLLSRDSDNKVQPGLAKSWDISNDGTTYTFHLNENMNFSNGDTLDAEDVAWSINQLKEQQYYNANQVESLEKAEAVDSDTVKLTLSTPDSNLLWYLTGRPGLVFDKDAEYNAKTEAVGSGPYTVESFDSASKMALKANPKYWGSAHKAATENVIIKFLTDDNAAVNALKSGEVDVLSPVNATLAKSLDTNTYQVSAADGSDKYVLAFNCANSKLADKRVRQAIRYGINHEEIIASRGNVDYALGGPIPSVDPGYEDLTDLYPYDVNKAKELMLKPAIPPIIR